jgi:hypothetical protein
MDLESEPLSRIDKLKFAGLGLAICLLWPLLLIIFPLFIFTTVQVLIRCFIALVQWIFFRRKPAKPAQIQQ